MLRRVMPLLLLLAVLSCGDSGSPTEPEPSLVGSWDLVGFSDHGVTATTTGDAIFRNDGTFHISGTVTFPDEPPDHILVDGTFRHTGGNVDLTIGIETTTWIPDFSGNQVTLTQLEPPPANTITLRRR